MDAEAVARHILATLPRVDLETTDDDSFFFAAPEGAPTDHRFPFATLVTSDRYDQASDLDRPGVFRLNIGISGPTYRTLFGSATGDLDDPGYDPTTLDRLMPHPVYGRQHWACVLNPGTDMLTAIRPLLEEAYVIAKERALRRPAAH